MGRIKSLNGYQKGVLLFMLAMVLVFAVIYPQTISKVGYRYHDAILVPTEENGDTVYSGKIQGEQACFTVSDDETVVFRYGDKTYGPYTVNEDPTAIPIENGMSGNMTGIELREGNDVLFRGGVLDLGNSYLFYSKDGTSDDFGFSYVGSDGIERDENGDPIDRMKPSVSTIYELVNNPELTHKGMGLAWFGAVFICMINAVSILFAEELFRLHLSFRIRNVGQAEPADWEIAGRYIAWTVIAIVALVLFILGLR